jgi:hypothetical protein
MSGRKVPRKTRLAGGVKSIRPDHGGHNMNGHALPRALSNGPALAAGELHISVDVWLYGTLARYGDKTEAGCFANVQLRLPEGSTMADLLEHLGVGHKERGITFINGQLSAMPGVQPDLNHFLRNGDRVGLFDLKSMWPFQYRHGATVTDEMARALDAQKDRGLHHTYNKG